MIFTIAEYRGVKYQLIESYIHEGVRLHRMRQLGTRDEEAAPARLVKILSMQLRPDAPAGTARAKTPLYAL